MESCPPLLSLSPPRPLRHRRRTFEFRPSPRAEARSPLPSPTAPGSPAGLPKKLVAMAAVALKNQLNALIASMYASGSVDEQFQQLQLLEEDGSSGFVREVVNLFIEDADIIIGKIAALLEQPVMDFDKVEGLVHQLKGSSGSVGAGKVKLMCQQFRQFFDAKSKDGCLMVLTIVRNEFFDVRNKFQTMLQLEEQIKACSTQ